MMVDGNVVNSEMLSLSSTLFETTHRVVRTCPEYIFLQISEGDNQGVKRMKP